jgi:hypothetical protein
MHNWGDTIEPAPLKRECHGCGVSEHLDEYSLCDGCRQDWDDEMTAILNRDAAERGLRHEEKFLQRVTPPPIPVRRPESNPERLTACDESLDIGCRGSLLAARSFPHERPPFLPGKNALGASILGTLHAISLDHPVAVQVGGLRSREIAGEPLERSWIVEDVSQGHIAVATEEPTDVSRLVVVVPIEHLGLVTALAAPLGHCNHSIKTVAPCHDACYHGFDMTETTLLTPRKHGGFPTIEECALHVYGPYQALISRPAWEYLGSPLAVAIGYDDRGYSIVPVSVEDRDAIRVYRHRKLSIGVIAGALRGSAFPLRITLIEENEIVSGEGFGGGITRLRFGDVA